MRSMVVLLMRVVGLMLLRHTSVDRAAAGAARALAWAPLGRCARWWASGAGAGYATRQGARAAGARTVPRDSQGTGGRCAKADSQKQSILGRGLINAHAKSRQRRGFSRVRQPFRFWASGGSGRRT